MKQPFNPTRRIVRQMKQHKKIGSLPNLRRGKQIKRRNRTDLRLNLAFGFVNSEGHLSFNWLIGSVHRSFGSDYGLFLHAAGRDTVHDEYQIFLGHSFCRYGDDEVVLDRSWRPAVLVEENRPTIEGKTHGWDGFQSLEV